MNKIVEVIGMKFELKETFLNHHYLLKITQPETGSFLYIEDPTNKVKDFKNDSLETIIMKTILKFGNYGQVVRIDPTLIEEEIDGGFGELKRMTFRATPWKRVSGLTEEEYLAKKEKGLPMVGGYM